MIEICKQRGLCNAHCELLGGLAASGVDVDMAVDAARRAAGLPYSQCEAGPCTSKPDGQGETFEYCGQRPEVQNGMRAVVLLHEAQQAVTAGGLPTLVQQP